MYLSSLIKGEAHPENQLIIRISAGLQETVEELDGRESAQTNTISATSCCSLDYIFRGNKR